MFAEIKMDLTDRGTVPNKTDVVSVEAELLGIETHPAEYLASVRFSGMIREETSAPAQPFAEVWNLTKPTQGSGGWCWPVSSSCNNLHALEGGQTGPPGIARKIGPDRPVRAFLLPTG